MPDRTRNPRPHAAQGVAVRRGFAVRPGFTLTELLVVIGLIVLILALALPAFNFITGTKSVDGAINVVSAFISRARVEALATQKITGVFFYTDPVTQRRALAMVQEDATQLLPGDAQYVEVYLDLMDREPTLLPVGIDVQVVNDATSAASGKGDRYLGFNNTKAVPANGTVAVSYGGAILFDSSGRLISPRWGLRTLRISGTTRNLTSMGRLMYPQATLQNPPGINNIAPANDPPVRGGLGFVLFDNELFNNAGYSVIDPQIRASGSAYTTAEEAEEAWLDENATPLLINRYNGTLVRGQ